MTGIEELLVAWLPTVVAARVATDIPANLADELPFVRVTRVGGPRRFSLAKPSVDIDVFAATRIAATDLAGQIEDAFTYRLPTVVDGHVLGFDGTYSGPAWRPYENPGVARVGASYGFLLHRA